MDIVVCVKQIPDPADPGALDPKTKTLKRDIKLIMDESDSYGVEMASAASRRRRRGRGDSGVDGAQRGGQRA